MALNRGENDAKNITVTIIVIKRISVQNFMKNFQNSLQNTPRWHPAEKEII